jgi:hypothetical protein
VGPVGPPGTTTWSGITGTPTTVAGYGITDAVTIETTQTITGQKTFTGDIYSLDYNFTEFTSTYLDDVNNVIYWSISDTTVNNVMQIDETGTLTIQGNALKPGGGAWSDSSDSRLKTNIQPLTNALSFIQKLNPVSYTWRYDNPRSPDVGFIAQEVLPIFPGAVTESNPTKAQSEFIPEGEKVLNIGWKNDMFAYLVSSIKELSTQVAQLTDEINMLKNNK